MNNDNDAIEKLKANQNRIQGMNNFTNSDNEFFNNPQMINKYQEEVEGAAGEAIGRGSTNKAGILSLRGIKKYKYYLIIGLIFALLIGTIFLIIYLNNGQLKGFFLTDNVNGGFSGNGSTSSSVVSVSGTKDVNAVVSEIYKSSTIASEGFFSSLKVAANNYNNYSLENGLSLIEGEFDIAMIAAAVHYNKFISDASVINGAINGYRTLSNMGIANSRRYSILPEYQLKSFYELADISLGTDLGIPDPELRGLTGNLVGSKVISACVSDNTGYLPTSPMTGLIGSKEQSYSVLDSTIIRYETLYYSGAPIYTYNKQDNLMINSYSRQLKNKLDTLRKLNRFEDYYDTSEFNENMNCGSKHLVHYVQKYMNYETFAKYLLNEYIPENYIECVDCSSNNKRADSIEIAYSIFNNRNEFSYFYYDDAIDTINFSNGDSLTTSKTEVQLPAEVKDNFISPFNLSAKCTISSPFTSNRSGYSHFAVDSYATDRTLVAVYDGVVKAVVNNVPNIYSQWNGGACVDSSGKMDVRSNGNYIVIEHSIGGVTYHSYYMHMETINVSPGDTVTKGQVIGTEGNTGCSSGYHLHYQLVSGSKRYDPTLLFAQCDGAQIITYGSKSLRDYLYSIYPDYTFTNINECIVKVYDNKEETSYSTMDLETYVAGVISSELGPSANFEALKAQAIAARNEYVARTNYCTSGEIVPNSSSFQNFSKQDVTKDRKDIITFLAARETTGKIITYSHGLLYTEYANFPCEAVYSCDDPDIYKYYYYDDFGNVRTSYSYVNGYFKNEYFDTYVPYYFKDTGEVTCRAEKRPDLFVDRVDKVVIGPNGNSSSAGATANGKCEGSGVYYYCGSTNIPRQFRKQEDLIGTVGDCSTLSYDLFPHSNNGKTFRTIPVGYNEISGGENSSLGHTDNPKEDYSNFYGHNRGMSGILANIYANKYGWDYEQIIHYFYDPEEQRKYDLINIETPLKFLDDQTEYEANYTDSQIGNITLPVTNNLTITVPVDFYVAGMLEYNFGSNVSSNLLKALAISNRTYALNKTKWGDDLLDTSGQYNYTYTNSKVIYDAVNATKDQLLVDNEGYITPTGYYSIGKNGNIKESNGEKTITYELGYLYNEDTHKVMIPYIDAFSSSGISSGNIGIVYNVASYLVNNWYFVDYYEVLKFFYGEFFNVVSLRNMSTVGAIKDSNGNVIGEGTTYSPGVSSANTSLEQYVSSNGKGTLNGVLAAAYWLYLHSNEVGDVSVPYQLGGEYRKIGINPNWGQIETNPRNEQYSKTGLDCVGFIRWAFINGYFNLPSDYGSEYFVYPTMVKYIKDKNLVCGENGESCYVEFHGENEKPVKGVSLAKYADRGLIQPGDVLYRYQGTVFSGESEAQKYSHIAIVYDVNLQNRTMTIIHCSGGDPGIKYSTINIDTGKYESGAKHSYTSVVRMSEMEKRGYFN